jgi:hypothetical protein
MLHHLTLPFEIAAIAAVCAVGFSLLYAERDDILGWWPGAWNRVVGFPVHNRIRLAKLGVCAKCIAGQVALWSWLAVDLFFHTMQWVTLPICVLSAIVTAKGIEKAVK